jgi:hypothetical protein
LALRGFDSGLEGDLREGVSIGLEHADVERMRKEKKRAKKLAVCFDPTGHPLFG